MYRILKIITLALLFLIQTPDGSAQRGRSMDDATIRKFINDPEWQPTKTGMRVAKAFLQRVIMEDLKGGGKPTQAILAEEMKKIQSPKTWLHTHDAKLKKLQFISLAIMLTDGSPLDDLRAQLREQFANSNDSLDERFEKLFAVSALIERLGIRSENDPQLERLGILVIGPPSNDQEARNKQAAYVAIELGNARDFALTWGSVYFHALYGATKFFPNYAFQNYLDNTPPPREVRIFDALPKKFRRINRFALFDKKIFLSGEDLSQRARNHPVTEMIREELAKLGCDLLLDSGRFNVLKNDKKNKLSFKSKNAAAITIKNEETGRIEVIAKADITLLILFAELHVVNVIIKRYEGEVPSDPMDINYRRRLGALERESNFAALNLAQKYGIQLSRERMLIGYEAINRSYRNFAPEEYGNIVRGLGLEVL